MTDVTIIKRIVSELERTHRCNCDLDNWQPSRTVGHSEVCRIYKLAVSKHRDFMDDFWRSLRTIKVKLAERYGNQPEITRVEGVGLLVGVSESGGKVNYGITPNNKSRVTVFDKESLWFLPFDTGEKTNDVDITSKVLLSAKNIEVIVKVADSWR